jgi:hypothetical protein
MDLRVGRVPSEATLLLALANLAESGQHAELPGYVGVNVVIEQDERRLFGFTLFAGHRSPAISASDHVGGTDHCRSCPFHRCRHPGRG